MCTAFGQGTGPIHRTQVLCQGFEPSILTCPAQQDKSSCTHAMDVGVICISKYYVYIYIYIHMHIVNKNKLSNKQTVCVIKGLHQISWQNLRFTCYVGIISAFWGVSWNISSYLVNFFMMAYYVIAVTPLTTTAVAKFLSSVHDDDENNDILLY